MIEHRSKILATVITIFILLATLSAWELFLKQPDQETGLVEVTIESGSTLGQVADLLQEKGVIASSWLFEWYARLRGIDRDIVAGTFFLNPEINVLDAIRSVTQPAFAEERQLTFLEGWSLREISLYLIEQGLIESEDELYAITSDPVSSDSLEGYLFPDTYRLFADATAQNVVDKMLENFDQKVTQEMRDEIEDQGRTLEEVITMASILEREARGQEDLGMVADIFWRRYEINMALQSCASVNYVTGKSDPGISYDDQQIDSLYNTYQYPGLPPGPISNPGLEAINAAIYPTANDYWYFLNDPDGGTHYATTNDEHAANKAMYLY
ncbi:MAG: endolytic transglycosylase MltG [Candidatus Uhrbacteria bacterium]